MKRANLICVLTVVAVAAVAQMAHANIIIPWTDNTIFWPGFPSGNSTKDHQNVIGDAYGEPHITGGTVVVDNQGYLVEITADFGNDWNFSIMKPGDLFLDTDNNGTWNYVLSFYNGRSTNVQDLNRYTPINNTGTGVLYPWTSSSQYLITGPDNSYYWSGYLIRNNHPYAATNLSNPMGTGSVIGGFPNNSPLTYILPAHTIQFLPNTRLTFGFTETCANNVVKETVTYVPEPSMLSLLIVALVSLSCLTWHMKE